MFLIAFEGHNGVGKSTIAKILVERLGAKYLYGVDEDSINNGLKEKFIKDAYWYSSALHFLAGCMETKRKILDNPKDDIYILDRSFWSTLAVHWNRAEEERKNLINVIKYGKSFLPIPNIIFILTAKFEICNERIANKVDEKEKELDSVVDRKYFDKETNFYQWLNTNTFKETTIINIDTTNKKIDEIVEECLREISLIRQEEKVKLYG